MGSDDRCDNIGIKFYLSSALRQYNLGLLTFASNTLGIAIPPNYDRSYIDSYCIANFSKEVNSMFEVHDPV
ncbi:unnamed protein product [Didymodactylos carnosus]|uniref:Uncharacterized protein n=1 Tax=Didymodactylos carnosus TaxID=1234261 RepID=A0A8S2I129_9BILA|nr:unnamed protein product [Didymodactylos carnosus]CAF3681777.1 unnamed protein product [Didymodactylos carnosus]